MAAFQITETVHCTERAQWRRWLHENHHTAKEIWLVSYAPAYARATGKPYIPYIETVEEGLCFGWVDGIGKKLDTQRNAQRFTPRRLKSHWTELNKERVRRLIAAGLMTSAGLEVLPDMSPEAFSIANDILSELQADPLVWQNFQQFPDLYQRIRISYIEEQRRKPDEFRRRLDTFITKTRQNKLFGTLE